MEENGKENRNVDGSDVLREVMTAQKIGGIRVIGNRERGGAEQRRNGVGSRRVCEDGKDTDKADFTKAEKCRVGRR